MSHKCFNGLSSCVEHNKPPSILDQAKAYTDSQRLAYVSNEHAMLTYDGNKEGKMIITSEDLGYTIPSDGAPMLVEYARFTNEVIYPHGIESILFGKEVFLWFYHQDLTFVTEDGVTSVFPKDRHFGELPIMVIADVDTPELRGTYSIHWNSGYVHQIEGAIRSTIHPIDPKFLPGVCLPVVELSTNLSGTDAIDLTAEESAMLTATLSSKSAIMLKCLLDTAPATLLMSYFDYSSVDDVTLDHMYFSSIEGTRIYLKKMTDSDIWQMASSE